MNKQILYKEIKRELFFFLLFIVLGLLLKYYGQNFLGGLILFAGYPLHLAGRFVDLRIKKHLKASKKGEQK